MADELETSGSQTAVADAGAAPDNSGAALQSEMTGDFFYDDGSDSVVDANGNTQRDQDGNPIRKMEDFTKVHGGQKPNAQPQSGKQGGVAAPANNQQNALGFDSVFQKEGKFDYNSIVSHMGKVNEFQYKMQTMPKPQAPQSVQAPQAPVDPKEQIRQEIATHKQTLEKTHLDPIRKAFQGIAASYQRAGQQVPQDVYDAVNAVYLEKEQEINDELDKKRDEIYLSRIENGFSEKEKAIATKESTANFKAVADQFLAHLPEAQRQSKMTELIFGYKNQQGAIVPGYGTEIVNHAFDTAMQGKQFNSDAEWSQAYNNWWLKYSSNPNNLAYLVKMSSALYAAANHSKYRDEYRRAWDAEQETKNRTRNQTSRASGNLGMQGGGEADLLRQYHEPPRRNNG